MPTFPLSWKCTQQTELTTGLRRDTLATVAVILSGMADVSPPDRNARRKRSSLVQWFKQNWNAIAPFCQFLELMDGNGAPMEWVHHVAQDHIIG
jgi:hypothetical protein